MSTEGADEQDILMGSDLLNGEPFARLILKQTCGKQSTGQTSHYGPLINIF